MSKRSSLPAGRSGIGLKTGHVEGLLEALPPLGFLEVHAENYMVAGGQLHHDLTRLREHYPLSIHGVALAIGAPDRLDVQHLAALKHLIDRYEPASFSEHLAWSSHGDVFLNDLLPLPYTADTLALVCDHIDQVQAALGRTMLLENPSTYLEFAASSYAEPQFITEVIKRTGCGLLLDVNNVYVSCVNHNRDAYDYIEALPLHAVGQFHLAGFDAQVDAAGSPLLIDTHGAPVAEAVWALYRHTLTKTWQAHASHLSRTGVGHFPATLIEWDNNVPVLASLLDQAAKAELCLQPLTPEMY
jgi:uncharacterized protein (UPF0276 family)